MCGIAGVIGPAKPETVARMVEAQVQRGPDDAGLYVAQASRIALGHRRLSIIDLSQAGHQPMSYADGRFWITYNGEVYNFCDIRVELQNLGHTFKSATDTEVLLAAYAQWGEACLDRFRGMFAFAILDLGTPISGDPLQHMGTDPVLFLARDRFGIKPLYYAWSGSSFVFASELKAILASGLVERRLDLDAIWLYLSLGSVPPPCTILSGVMALLPGHWMRVSHGGVEIRRYWDLSTSRAADYSVSRMSAADVEAELRRRLEEATRLHMIADVPVGAFLSGGIDSAAVVGLMCQFSDAPLRTYSIGFEGDDRRWSELPWAEIVSRRFGTDHHEIVVNGDDIARDFDRLICAVDQPSSDGVNTYFVSKHTRTGVTVALSGLGGDELFAGYPQFRWFVQADRLPLAARPLAATGARLFHPPGLRRWHRIAQFVAAEGVAQKYALVRTLYSDREKASLLTAQAIDSLGATSLADYYAPFVRQARDLDPVARTSYLEANTYMAHTLLRDTDAMSMAHSLEVRVPLLDHKLAEFAFALPPQFKLDGRRAKLVLVHSLRDLLPEETVSRRKMGFELPMGGWLAGPLLKLATEVLSSREARQLFTPLALEQMMQQARHRQGPYGRVWAPIVLVAWMQEYGCGL